MISFKPAKALPPNTFALEVRASRHELGQGTGVEGRHKHLYNINNGAEKKQSTKIRHREMRDSGENTRRRKAARRDRKL